MSIARKSLAIVASVSLAMGLAACNRDSAGDGSVTLALSTQTNPFFVQLRDGAQAKADELGITLNIQDASDDASTQINQLNNAASSGADVVIVNPTDSDAVVPAVEALNNADIPVIAVDRSSNGGEVASFIASDNVAGGRQAADALAAAIGGWKDLHWFDTVSFVAVAPRGQSPDGDTSEADDAGWFPPQLLLDGWRHGLVRLAIPTWAQLSFLAQFPTAAEALAGANAADLNPVIGDPVDDPRYAEYFTTAWVDRIRPNH